jgi:hypothetical protein
MSPTFDEHDIAVSMRIVRRQHFGSIQSALYDVRRTVQIGGCFGEPRLLLVLGDDVVVVFVAAAVVLVATVVLIVLVVLVGDVLVGDIPIHSMPFRVGRLVAILKLPLRAKCHLTVSKRRRKRGGRMWLLDDGCGRVKHV